MQISIVKSLTERFMRVDHNNRSSRVQPQFLRAELMRMFGRVLGLVSHPEPFESVHKMLCC